MNFVVTCIPGLASLLSEELTEVGLEAAPGGAAAVSLQGGVEEALRVCLWSRLAERVLLPVGEAEAPPDQAPELLARAFALDDHLVPGVPLNVHVDHEAGVRGDPRVSSAVFCRNLPRRVALQRAPEGALCLRILVRGESSSLLVDLAGTPLSRRGYRVHGGPAPLRESLAAALLRIAGWRRPDLPAALVDPFCGSGTIGVEAALIARGQAPGLLREQFGFRQWRGFRPALWQRLCDDARERLIAAPAVSIKAFDADEQVLRLARHNAERAGVQHLVHFERRELGLLGSRDFAGHGMVVTNPPWGERLEDRQRVSALHQALGGKLASEARGWPLTLLGTEVEVLDRVPAEVLAASKVRNGPFTNYIRTLRPTLRTPVRALLPGEPVFSLPEQAVAFANRLRKNGRQLRRWLDAEQVQAYRLYDRDLPEFNFSVDVYGEHVLVQEFAPPRQVDPAAAAQRRTWAISAVRAVLEVHRERVFMRTRAPQKGSAQYQKTRARPERQVVREGRARLMVNLSAYLDTGLFLDHRPVRLMFGDICGGRRFLNLFGYTGAATAHAALGGARSSVTVDASATYLEWAAENLALNGFSTHSHRLERGDAMDWLQSCRQQFDVVFCDPPTFSNSKGRGDFVVQRDHPELIRWIMKRLEPGGVLYFSNNFRRFVLDDSVRKGCRVEDLTRWSTPPDFARHRPHHLFAIRHPEQ